MEKIWGPWLASNVSESCVAEVVDIDAALAGFELPVEGWHASVAEVMSIVAAKYSEVWPPADRELVAWLRLRPYLATGVDFTTAGLALVRGVDESICLTLGGGRVAESWGGGLVINHFPTRERYVEAFEMPYTVYMRSVRGRTQV